jgi:hypothetical protein
MAAQPAPNADKSVDEIMSKLLMTELRNINDAKDAFTNAQKLIKLISDSQNNKEVLSVPGRTFGYLPLFTSNDKLSDTLKDSLIDKIGEYISEGLKLMKKQPVVAAPQEQGGGKKSKKDKDRKKVRGGAVPDFINNVAAFQNVGGLLATASPLDNAQQMIPAIYNAGSFNAGLLMPTSAQGLPMSYNLVTNPQTAGSSAQSGGKAKKNRDKDEKKKRK